MNTWIISDTHFHHANILKYCGRPFKSVEDMNETLIDNWNKVVASDDDVYHLGDVAFADTYKAILILRRLNGRKFLLQGNHDHKNLKNPKFAEFFVWTKDIYQLHYEKQMLVLCHYPLLSWNGLGHGSFMLHGHSHFSVNNEGVLRMDVGVDNPVTGFAPMNVAVIVELLESKRKTLKTGFDTYLDDRLKDPEFKKAYDLERKKLSIWQKVRKALK